MKNYLKKLLGLESEQKEKDLPKSDLVMNEKGKDLKEVFEFNPDNLTSYDYEMISKRNRLATLP
ncbi:MAG: hypothetical protein AAFO82_13765 [Bacteroidota bacterium]